MDMSEVLKIEYHPEWTVYDGVVTSHAASMKNEPKTIWMHIGNGFYGLVNDKDA